MSETELVGLGKTFPALDLALDSLADELCALVWPCQLVNALCHAIWEAHQCRLHVHRRSPHAGHCARVQNKRQFLLQKRYRLLTVSDIAYRVKSSKREKQMTLTNQRDTGGDKFWNIEVNGKVVGALQKPNRAFGGWYVASRDDREIREHFTSKDAALAFAATL